jgi:hypothetical protein
MADRDELIRQRAYDLWDRAGRPEGREAEHWHQAEREISDELGGASHGLREDKAAPYADEQPERTGQAEQASPLSKPNVPRSRQKPVAGGAAPQPAADARKRGRP